MSSIVTRQYTFAERPVGASFKETQQLVVAATMKCHREPVEDEIDFELVRLIMDLDPRYSNPGGVRTSKRHGNETVTLGSIDVEPDDEVGLETTPDCWALIPGAGVSLSSMPATDVLLRRQIAEAVIQHTGWSILDGERQDFIRPHDIE